jgi:mannose-6-phosphate isomerase-like protein (cupin superfamily)
MSYPKVRYRGERGEINAVFRPAEPSTAGTQYLATSRLTQGEFGLYQVHMGPHSPGPSTHFHRTISESFFILSGEIDLFDGDEWITARQDDFLYVPVGGLHAFRNSSGSPASMLLLFAPGAPREEYFETLVEAATSGRQLSDEEWTEFFLRHDTYWV